MNSTALKTQFKCLKKLGVGGTAEVFLATSDNYTKPIALKTPLPDSDYESFHRLARREATLIEGLNFPGLVRLHQINTSDDPFIVLDYCSGSTLEDFQTDNHQTILNILSAIALNLEFLKLRQIIHGDFKPENIFLPTDNNFTDLFYVRFSDFSLGRKFEEPESERAGVGTLGYSAPETIGSNQTDHRSDIFALGVIAFQMFCGEHPFCDDFSDPVKVNSAIQENEPKDISRFCPGLSSEIIKLIMSMLSKYPKARPQSGWEICQKLEHSGATYPYRRALAPKYLFPDKQLLDKLELTEKQQYELTFKTNNDADTIRLVLGYNFIKENLAYNGNKFEFDKDILFPPYLFRTFIKEFSQLNYSDQKELISLALDSHVDLNSTDQIETADRPRYYYELILNLISKRTIQRLAQKKLADISRENYPQKTILAILSGDPELTEDAAFQATSNDLNEKNFVRGLKLLNSAIRFLNVSGKEFEARQLLKLKGTLYKNMGEIEKSERVFLDVVKLYHNRPNDALLAEIYKELGNTYKFKQNFQKGIEALDKALEIYEELGDELEISHTYNNTGNIYFVSNDYKAALSSYLKALRIQKRLEATDDVASTITNMGSIYAMSGKFKRALKLLEISLVLKKRNGNLGEIARTLNNMGYLHHLINNTDKAIESLQESLEYNRRIGNKKEILINMENLIAMMFLSGDIKKTVGLLKEGLKLAEELEDIPNKAMFSIYMGSVLTRLGKIDDALYYYNEAEELVNQTDDKINNIILNTERANTFFLSGDIKSAENIIDVTLPIVEAVSELNYKVGFLLVAYKITGDQKFYDNANEIITKLNLFREGFILAKLKLHHSIPSEDKQATAENYKVLSERLNRVENDIELSEALLFVAEFHIENNNIEKAQQVLAKAQQQIKTQNLSFEQIMFNTLMGQIKFKENDYEGCFGFYKQALAKAKEIAGTITDANMRNCFQSKPIIGFLVKNIKEFSQKIAKK